MKRTELMDVEADDPFGEYATEYEASWPSFGEHFANEIADLIPPGATPDDARLLTRAAEAALNTAAAVAPHTGSHPVEVVGDRHELTDHGLETIAVTVDHGVRVLDCLAEHFPFARGSDREELYWAGIDALSADSTSAPFAIEVGTLDAEVNQPGADRVAKDLPPAISCQDIRDAMTFAWNALLRHRWVAPSHFRLNRSCDLSPRRSTLRPHQSQRRVRSVRLVRATRGGCSPGRRSADADPPELTRPRNAADRPWAVAS